MPADHDRHHLAKRAVGDLLLDVGELGVEALRIADGEFEPPRRASVISSSASHSSMAMGFSRHVLAGSETVARDRVVVLLPAWYT